MEQINVNLIPGRALPVCHVSQYDVGRQIRCNLFEGDQVFALATGDTAEIHVRKPDMTVVTEALTVVNAQTYLDIVTTQQMDAVAGSNLCEIQLKRSGNTLGTLNFIMEVEEDPTDNAFNSQSSIHDLNAQVNAIVGNQLYSIENTLENYNSNNELGALVFPSLNYAGITITYDYERGCYVLNGTNTVAISFNIYADANKLPGNIKAGDLLTWKISRSSSDVILKRFIQTTDNPSWHGERWLTSHINSDGILQEVISSTSKGWLLRISIDANKTFNNDTLYFSVVKYLPNFMLEKGCPVVFSHATLDQTSLIESILSKFGCVMISPGTHVINDLHMPDNTMIKGCGNLSILQTTDNTKNGIVVGTWCSIENVSIFGTRASALASPANDAGIYIEGNYENAPLKRNTRIHGCFIKGFGHGGIVGKATGYWVADSITADDCEIINCYAGIRLIDFCEFNRFTNMLCYNNTVGLVCCSGNNVFVNCSFSNNKVGVYLIGDDANLSGNNGHGAIIGSTINHSDNNNGYAIIVRGLKNGFIFEGCNIWYGKILCDVNTGDQSVGCSGILISNALIGGGTPEIINWGADALILSNCIFKVTPTFTGNQETIKNNCYMYDGTPVT